MGNSKTLTVKTENGDVIVRKLALGDYAQLLHALKKLPGELGGMIQSNDGKSLQDLEHLFTVLPALIADSIPEFAQVLAVATDKDDKFFMDGDLADAIDVFAAVLELNDYSRIMDSVKKIQDRKTAKPPKPAKAEETPST